MSALEALRDALARVVYLRESLDVGDIETACAIAADLEHDLAGVIARLEEFAA